MLPPSPPTLLPGNTDFTAASASCTSTGLENDNQLNVFVTDCHFETNTPSLLKNVSFRRAIACVAKTNYTAGGMKTSSETSSPPVLIAFF